LVSCPLLPLSVGTDIPRPWGRPIQPPAVRRCIGGRSAVSRR